MGYYDFRRAELAALTKKQLIQLGLTLHRKIVSNVNDKDFLIEAVIMMEEKVSNERR